MSSWVVRLLIGRHVAFNAYLPRPTTRGGAAATPTSAPHEHVTGKTRFSRRLFSKHHRADAIPPLRMRFSLCLFRKRPCVVSAMQGLGRSRSAMLAVMFRISVLRFDSKLDFSGIETSRASSFPSFGGKEKAIPNHHALYHWQHDELPILEV